MSKIIVFCFETGAEWSWWLLCLLFVSMGSSFCFDEFCGQFGCLRHGMKAEKRNKNEDKTKMFDEKEKINEVLFGLSSILFYLWTNSICVPVGCSSDTSPKAISVSDTGRSTLNNDSCREYSGGRAIHVLMSCVRVSVLCGLVMPHGSLPFAFSPTLLWRSLMQKSTMERFQKNVT